MASGAATDGPPARRRPASLLPAWLRSLGRRLLGRAGGPPVLALVIPADAALVATVRALQAELAGACRHPCDLATPPHVTLKLGFAAADAEAVARWLAALAVTAQPLELTVGGLGAFDEGILFLEVAPAPGLEALRRRILGELSTRFGVVPWPLEVGDGFRFHVTVATGLAPGALAAALRHLGAGPAPRRLAVERLGLLRAEGDGWVAWREATIGAGPGAGPEATPGAAPAPPPGGAGGCG